MNDYFWILKLRTLDLEAMTFVKNLEAYEEHKFFRRAMLRYYKYLWLSFQLKLHLKLDVTGRIRFLMLRANEISALEFFRL